VINLLLDYLLHPIDLACNTPAMVAVQGDTHITIYDTRAVDPDDMVSVPYVKLAIADANSKALTLGFSPGYNRIEVQYIDIEVVTQGESRKQATDRSSFLIMAIEGAAMMARNGAPVLRMDDLGGSSSHDVITHWVIGQGSQQPPVGPGQVNTWTSIRNTVIEAAVEICRK
jgi:hypothetical protein